MLGQKLLVFLATPNQTHLLMELRKTDVPLALLKALEPLYEKNKDIVKFKKLNLFYAEHRKHNSDLYFAITKCEAANEKVIITVEYKPANQNVSVSHNNRIYLDNLANEYNLWLSMVKEYERVKSIDDYDDELLKAYKEEFFQMFESAEEDADIKPFNLKQQLLLDTTIAKIIRVLEEHKEEDNEEETEAIIKEAKELQESITISTKNEVLRKFSTILAKSRKLSLKVMKAILPVIQKDLIETISKKVSELPSTIVDLAGSIIDSNSSS